MKFKGMTTMIIATVASLSMTMSAFAASDVDCSTEQVS